MLRVVRTVAPADSGFDAVMTGMVKSMVRNLNLVLSGSLVMWYIVATATWPETYSWPARGLAVLLAGICGLSLWLHARRPVLADTVWQIGMISAITLGIYVFRSPTLGILFVLLPFVAVVTSGWMAALLVQTAIFVNLTWLSHETMANVALGPYFAVILIGGLCSGLVGFVLVRTLLTAVEWYVAELARAEANLESARTHRSQLMRVQKSLDEAYYQLKRANAALVAAWKAADAAERFKSEFVANVSHELRTPLNLIVGYSEVIMTSPESYGRVQLPSVYRTDINAIYHSAQHLLALVDDVLDLARIDVGKLSLSRDEVDVISLVMEALDIVRDYVVTKGLDLQVNLAPDLPKLWIDRLRIRQVVLNLLVNAARFTEKGFIRVDAQQADGQVLIRVADSGRGISDQDLPKIFDEFRSTEQPMSTWHSGTGLGLPISKKFVELSGGKMGVESVFAQGTAFWFTLPCRPPDTAPVVAGTRHHPAPVETLATADRVVVVVHDDRRVVSMLERHLDEYSMVHASNLTEGIEIAARSKALALLTDTDADGLELPTTTFCIHCASSDPQATRMLDADHILVKPVTRRELEATVRRVHPAVKRILIADDDPELVRLFRRMLSGEEQEREFVEAYNGEEALQLMRLMQPDLVLLDLVMPGADGFSVLEQMAADAALSHIASIVISAKGLELIGEPTVHKLEICRAEGFRLGEIAGAIDATLKALTPGWYVPEARSPMLEAAGPG